MFIFRSLPSFRHLPMPQSAGEIKPLFWSECLSHATINSSQHAQHQPARSAVAMGEILLLFLRLLSKIAHSILQSLQIVLQCISPSQVKGWCPWKWLFHQLFSYLIINNKYTSKYSVLSPSKEKSLYDVSYLSKFIPCAASTFYFYPSTTNLHKMCILHVPGNDYLLGNARDFSNAVKAALFGIAVKVVCPRYNLVSISS